MHPLFVGWIERPSRGEMVKKAAVILVVVVLHLATACAPSAPTVTPTPEPTATPVWVLATKPEHLEGIWLDAEAQQYQQWTADGTISGAYNVEDLDKESSFVGTFWFEEGIYYEDSPIWCIGTGAYKVYLRIEAGRAVRLRMELVEDPCLDRRQAYRRPVVRVD
jgi:hypothetical protein